MKALRELKIGAHRAWRVAIAIALLSSLTACSKQEPSSAVATGGNQVASAASSGAEATRSSVDPAPASAIEQRAEPSKPNADEALAARIKSRFIDAGLATLAVDVTSSNGAVALYGTVDSSETRDKAARIVSSVEGVKSVANKLVIVRGS